jgi:hypothetical protein
MTTWVSVTQAQILGCLAASSPVTAHQVIEKYPNDVRVPYLSTQISKTQFDKEPHSVVHSYLSDDHPTTLILLIPSFTTLVKTLVCFRGCTEKKRVQ